MYHIKLGSRSLSLVVSAKKIDLLQRNLSNSFKQMVWVKLWWTNLRTAS